MDFQNMKKNVGPLDKYLRIGVGLLLIVLAGLGTIGVWGYIGIVPLATGVFGTCPLYQMLGINTCNTEPPPTA
jgi:hypothetical protein